VKSEVVRQGTGENARVLVRLHDGKSVEGYITRIAADRFTVVTPETREETTVYYKTVAEINKIDETTKLVIALPETANTGELLIKAIF